MSSVNLHREVRLTVSKHWTWIGWWKKLQRTVSQQAMAMIWVPQMWKNKNTRTGSAWDDVGVILSKSDRIHESTVTHVILSRWSWSDPDIPALSFSVAGAGIRLISPVPPNIASSCSAYFLNISFICLSSNIHYEFYQLLRNIDWNFGFMARDILRHATVTEAHRQVSFYVLVSVWAFWFPPDEPYHL